MEEEGRMVEDEAKEVGWPSCCMGVGPLEAVEEEEMDPLA